MTIELNKLKRGEQFRLTDRPTAPLWTKYGLYGLSSREGIIIHKGNDIMSNTSKVVNQTKLVYV